MGGERKAVTNEEKFALLIADASDRLRAAGRVEVADEVKRRLTEYMLEMKAGRRIDCR